MTNNAEIRVGTGITPIEVQQCAAGNAPVLHRASEKKVGRPYRPGEVRPTARTRHFERQVGPSFSGSEPIPTHRR